jgi:hypothetical protein
MYSFSFHLGLYKKYAVKQKCSRVLWVLRQTSKGRTIRYLRGGLGKYLKKIRAQKKFRKKISCTTNLLKKKIEQGLGLIFKIVVQLF